MVQKFAELVRKRNASWRYFGAVLDEEPRSVTRRHWKMPWMIAGRLRKKYRIASRDD